MRNRSPFRRFEVAFEISYMCNSTWHPRTQLGSIWAALDALFGRDEKSLGPRMCRRIASWLPEKKYEDIRYLYTTRCDAIHGRRLDAQHFLEVLNKSYELLRCSLVRVIEKHEEPLPDWSLAEMTKWTR
jgi:hypothetical protein